MRTAVADAFDRLEGAFARDSAPAFGRDPAPRRAGRTRARAG
jgi:hypothetical protein